MSRYCSLVVLLTLALLHGTAMAQVKVRAAYGTPSLSQVVFPLGVQSGMFNRHGLSVESVYIAGRSISALLGGDVQFGFTGGPQTILARLSGADLIIIDDRLNRSHRDVGVIRIDPKQRLIATCSRKTARSKTRRGRKAFST